MKEGNTLKHETFHSHYGFKIACRNNRSILYEGLLQECSNELLEQLKNKLEHRKYIMIWE